MHEKVPHLALPVRRDAAHGGFASVEQDTLDEIAQSVEIILATPVGSRVDLPTFGAPDFVFRQSPVDVNEAIQAVSNWDPRAALSLTETAIDEFTVHIEAAVRART